MKKISVLLALVALLFCDLVLAASTAVATSVTGNVQVQTGSAPARTLRTGDELAQGDTVSTGAGSSVVLKFDDGQVAALTANSRMTITSYQYEPSTGSGNVLLSLVSGGMRAITGLIGRRSPNQVAYRAATATIGIRGTDVTIATADGNVVVSVNEGSISFTMNNQTVVIPAGQAIRARPDGTFSRGAINQIARDLQGTPAGQAILNALGGIDALAAAVNAANAGTPRGGPPGQTGDVPPGPPQQTPGQGPPPGGGAGGGGGQGSRS